MTIRLANTGCCHNHEQKRLGSMAGKEENHARRGCIKHKHSGWSLLFLESWLAGSCSYWEGERLDKTAILYSELCHGRVLDSLRTTFVGISKQAGLQCEAPDVFHWHFGSIRGRIRIFMGFAQRYSKLVNGFFPISERCRGNVGSHRQN